jgi:hypothetical protein
MTHLQAIEVIVGEVVIALELLWLIVARRRMIP